MSESLQQLQEIYQQHFGDAPQFGYFSPGRINLIGEHLDYNGGAVMPAAISLGTYGLVRPRNERVIRLYSHNFASSGVVAIDLEDLNYKKNDGWVSYIKGILWQLERGNRQLEHGFDLLIYGTLPHGSGLSSSASLEVLIGYICDDLFNFNLSPLMLAQLGMQVENGYIGVNSGIMDQFAIALGKANCALFLETSSLAYEHVKVNLPGYSWLIMNTNKPRQLADSKYNQRKKECDRSLALLKRHFAVEHLAQLPYDVIAQLPSLLQDEVLVGRARHVISEHQRTVAARQLLEAGKSQQLGQLLVESHNSLANDYEVAGFELDVLVEAANAQSGVAGARMTGAGFGGCAIALVESSKVAEVAEAVASAYLAQVGYGASFSVASLSGELQKLF